MRTIKTTSGHEIALDGDLLAVLEALFTRSPPSASWSGRSRT